MQSGHAGVLQRITSNLSLPLKCMDCIQQDVQSSAGSRQSQVHPWVLSLSEAAVAACMHASGVRHSYKPLVLLHFRKLCLLKVGFSTTLDVLNGLLRYVYLYCVSTATSRTS